ncbi:MAG: thioredoxin family protein [Bacteroidia bacterium]|nr:thioredoxin family protein [Bacteroidia bacterium]
MKTIILFITFFTMCTLSNAQINSEKMLLGEQTYRLLINDNSYPWFKSGVMQYGYNSQTVSSLKNYTNNGDIHFVVFGGSWCDDTHKLLPQFFKVVLDAGFSEQDIYLYMLDREKTCPTKNEKGLNITNLPTFIVYRNGQEIGRIIETVQKSIEADLLEILAQ